MRYIQTLDMLPVVMRADLMAAGDHVGQQSHPSYDTLLLLVVILFFWAKSASLLNRDQKLEGHCVLSCTYGEASELNPHRFP
ncbi:hypothetical protein L1887_13865 [Cichorium endivia]|nr:hypothetical protein L1887_13865 [Cichorium endivia]